MCPRPRPDYVVAGAAVAQLGRARREEASKGRQQTVQVLPGTEGKLPHRRHQPGRNSRDGNECDPTRSQQPEQQLQAEAGPDWLFGRLRQDGVPQREADCQHDCAADEGKSAG
uniref:(northern house mosquito) hypothetical protein n=1 Tax=Culex pipiens TaxID=7175 RepID=A0A8D8KU86_CULPI